MGEACQQALRVGFDRAIKLEFQGARGSSDAGLFLFRDLDEAAQLTESSAAELIDFRNGRNIRHAMPALLRQSIYSRLAGYEDINDAERLRVDPVMRHVVGGRAVDRDAASTSQVGRFEADVLCHPDNLDAIIAMSGQWVCRRRQPNESERGDAMSVDNLGTKRLSGHPKHRFCLNPPSVGVQGSLLHLNSAGKWWYIHTLGDWRCCRAKVIWEMSAQMPEKERSTGKMTLQNTQQCLEKRTDGLD